MRKDVSSTDPFLTMSDHEVQSHPENEGPGLCRGSVRDRGTQQIRRCMKRGSPLLCENHATRACPCEFPDCPNYGRVGAVVPICWEHRQTVGKTMEIKLAAARCAIGLLREELGVQRKQIRRELVIGLVVSLLVNTLPWILVFNNLLGI